MIRSKPLLRRRISTILDSQRVAAEVTVLKPGREKQLRVGRGFSRDLEFMHFESHRPVRDEMNLARHFSAGASENVNTSSIRDE